MAFVLWDHFGAFVVDNHLPIVRTPRRDRGRATGFSVDAQHVRFDVVAPFGRGWNDKVIGVQCEAGGEQISADIDAGKAHIASLVADAEAVQNALHMRPCAAQSVKRQQLGAERHADAPRVLCVGCLEGPVRPVRPATREEGVPMPAMRLEGTPRSPRR